MDADDIEHVIEEELEKMSVNFSDAGSDSETDIEENFSAFDEKLKNDLPDSVLVYFKASSNRVKAFEQLILEDIEDFETMCNEMFSPSQHADPLNELVSNSDEDPLKLKERIMAEIEAELEPPCETYELNGDDDTEYDTHKDSERQLRFEWRQLEERLRQEEEEEEEEKWRLAELETESEQHLKSDSDDKVKMRWRIEQFNEDLRRAMATNQFEYIEPVEGDGEISQTLRVEMVQQQELIKRLEEQIAEERRVFEEVQQKERWKSEARCTAAATKIQAAFRGTLVRRWSSKELNKRREEERRRQEEKIEREKKREREERMKLEWEKERRRMEEEEQHHRNEADRRRAEYERAKQQEHHRLERERRLEEQNRKEKDEAKRRENVMKVKGEEKQKSIEQMSVEEEMRTVQEEKYKEDENAKVMIQNEIKGKEDVESQKEIEERSVEDKKRKVQEDKKNTSKERKMEQRTVDELKEKDEDGLPEITEEKRMGEVRKKVQEDEEKTRKKDDEGNRKGKKAQKGMKERRLQEERKRKEVEEEKKIEDERRRKKEEEEKQKNMEIERVKAERRRLEEERKRKEVEKAKKIEDERKRTEEEYHKIMEIRGLKNEKKKVQVEEEKKRKDVKEARRTEDERKSKMEERQKSTDVWRVEEEKVRRDVEEGKRTEAEIERNEEEEKQKRMREKQVVEEIRIKQKQNKPEQVQEEQRKNLKQKDREGEEIVIRRNDDGQNMEERNRNVMKDNVKALAERKNTKADKESEKTTKWGKDEKCMDNESQLRLSQSVNMSKSVLARTLSSRTGQDEQPRCFLVSALSTDNRNITVSPCEKKSLTDPREPLCALGDSSSACLPDSTEQKRLAWMINCTPWSKLSMQNKRKGLGSPPRRRRRMRASGQNLLPLPVDAILKSGPWNSLKQVTTVTLEDLSGCSLSTLSECTRLQTLTLRRCRLQALDGLNQCTELQHVDFQENSITYVDCRGLTKLEVLMLGRNQLTSIHGLDDAVNLTVLQLSHNIISRISGLGSLKRLHRLTVDHNQLISTRGLGEAFMLLHLDCSYNHLSHVEGLENCALLNTLDLRGNNLTEMPVLKNHVLLRELYLDDNSICSLHSLDSCWLPLLRCLSVPQNSITQLPLLVDLLSLKTLNVSHNCLSELRNICMSLQGCTHLQELSIADNPVQQENNWRSSVLAVNPTLIKLNGEQTGASGKLSADSTQLWSFQALCQAHQYQIDSILQRHCMEISSAPSAPQAQLLVSNHTAELFQLAEEQRYAHEYGDSGVCETAMQEPVPSSHLKESSDCDLTQEKGDLEKTPNPAEHNTPSCQAPHLPNCTHKYQPPSGDHNAGCAGSCVNPPEKFRDTHASEDKYRRYGVQASRMDLRTVAVMVIQRRWREHRQRRRTSHLEPPAIVPAKLSPQREVKSCTTRPKCLNKDYAATVIQAVWRGYMLRKRLTRALMLAQISEADEAFEEVDMDEFIFYEEAMEKDWIPLDPDMSPSSVLPNSEQLPLPKRLRHLPELHETSCMQPWKPRQAWISTNEAPVSEPCSSQSSDPSTSMHSPASTLGKSYFSERSEKILEEWGFSSGSTAHLMLKRAQRMKPQKQKNLKKYSAGRGDVSAQEALRAEPDQTYTHTQTRHRTYQWLQTQAVPSRRSSAPSTSDHFLPEIDPEILNGGRVQLVASTGYRETPDSAMRIDSAGYSTHLPQNHQAHTRTHSAGHTKKDVPSPQRVTLAPSRKERISFRDNPVQLSGGWGGGKKRSKANKFT